MPRRLSLVLLLVLPVAAQPDWSGRWEGTLVNLPARAGAKAVQVTREIGPLTGSEPGCAAFRTTYREEGAERGVKDYRLCRGPAAGEYYFDEGNGVKLAAGWLGEVLVSAFRVKGLLLVSQLRVREGVMEEEILTIADQPPAAGVQSLPPRSIQRLELRRAASALFRREYPEIALQR